MIFRLAITGALRLYLDELKYTENLQHLWNKLEPALEGAWAL